jgi:hypothetical protein
MIRRPTWNVLPLLVTLALAACGSQSKGSSSGSASSADTMTEWQRDSMLSTSRIPGVQGVGVAMRAADATSRGIRAADSVAP